MDVRIPPNPSQKRRIYSVPPDVEGFLARVLADHSGRPTLRLHCGVVPQIRPPAADAPSLDDELSDLFMPPARPGPGHPPRNAYCAAEVAYLAEIERRPLIGDSTAFGLHEQLGKPALRDVGGPVERPEDARGALKSDTVREWRNVGRLILAQHGAWPWACKADGRLRKTWRRDPCFMDALAAWAEEPTLVYESGIRRRVSVRWGLLGHEKNPA
jgi:hypothetical protein